VDCPLEYICSCGNLSKTSFYHFQKGVRCKKCGTERAVCKRRYDFQYVENYFKEKGCKLLETQYKNNKTKMKYTCKCGRNSEITFNHFLKDVRCRDCYKSECKGEMNPNWNPDRQQVKDNALFARKAYNSLHQVLSSIGDLKSGKYDELMGYSLKDLELRIKSHPNWNKVKNSDWHLDHIFPIKAFLDYRIHDIKLINCLENLQPLSSIDNCRKSSKYCKKQFECWLESKFTLAHRNG
jgi:hypothetical protein